MDLAARQQAMINCQGLVRSLAWKIYQKLPVSVDLEDLVAYGQLGLAEAANAFDPSKGFQFTTFAYYRIRGAILDGLAELSWFDPADYHGSKYRSGCDPEGEDPDLYALPKNREAQSRMVSMGDSHADVEDKRSMVPDTRLATIELCNRIRQLVADMEGDEGELIRAAYYEGIPLSEAAKRLGISRSWASRLHERALGQLGRSMGDTRM